MHDLWNSLHMLSIFIYFRRQFGCRPTLLKTVTIAQAINCGFARVAVFLSGQKKSGNGKVSEVKSLDLPLEAMFRSS